MSRFLSRSTGLFALALSALAPLDAALAVVGGVVVAPGAPAARWTVRIEGARGELCSGVAISRQIVLTAAHCVIGGGSFRVVAAGASIRVTGMVAHESFKPGHTPSTQPGVDLALLRLQRPMPAAITPTRPGGSLGADEMVTIAGFGLGEEGRAGSARRLRQAELRSAGNYTMSNSVMVAVDPERRGALPGAGACKGDSGGPIMRASSGEIVGLVSWSSAPVITRNRRVCGGFTAITPLAENAAWIDATAARLAAGATPGAQDGGPGAWTSDSLR